MDMGIEPFLLSATLVGVVAQRLVRRVCAECAQPETIDEERLAQLGIRPEELAGAKVQLGSGCSHCRETGYRGRLAVFEYLPVTSQIRDMIAEQAGGDKIDAAARAAGVRTLRQDALTKLVAGQTSADEMLRIIA
jgi:type II secretory ATPase GspE/PulE/Tfp pilus assembly ATPase PilB-like protein